MSANWLAVLLFTAIPGVYYVALGQARIDEIDSLHAQIDSLRARTTAADEDARRLRGLEQELAQLEEWAQRLRARLAPDPAAAPLILEVSATLRSFGLEAEHAETMLADERPSFENERVQLSVLGAFPDLFHFIGHVENGRPPGRVTSLVVRPASVAGRVRADLSLERFWSPDS